MGTVLAEVPAYKKKKHLFDSIDLKNLKILNNKNPNIRSVVFISE